MMSIGFISGSSVVQTPSSSSSVRSSRIHSFGMWNASRRSARLTLRSRRSSRLPRLFSGSNLRFLSEKPSIDICTRILSWKYCTTRSNTSGSARREMNPISFIAVTIRVVSRVIAPCRNDTIPRRISSLTVAVAPKSRNTIVGGPSARDRRRDQQVPGVRIGVVEAVDEDLLAVGLDADARRRAPVDLQALEPFEVGDLRPLHPLGRQHARGRVRRHHLGKRTLGVDLRAAKLAAIFSIADASRR